MNLQFPGNDFAFRLKIKITSHNFITFFQTFSTAFPAPNGFHTDVASYSDQWLAPAGCSIGHKTRSTTNPTQPFNIPRGALLVAPQQQCALVSLNRCFMLPDCTCWVTGQRKAEQHLDRFKPHLGLANILYGSVQNLKGFSKYLQRKSANPRWFRSPTSPISPFPTFLLNILNRHGTTDNLGHQLRHVWLDGHRSWMLGWDRPWHSLALKTLIQS